MAPIVSTHSSQSRVNNESVCFHGDLQFDRNPILILNETLDDLQVPHGVNEQAIESYLQILEAFAATDQPVYWLAMSRLLELSLICAGHYADNCEFSAAGDLLVNPRIVFIHRNGEPHPLVKHRHGRLTDQLNKKGACRESVLSHLRNDVRVEVVAPALLPYLLERIEQSCHIASWYLYDVQERMKKIADTIGFLSAWSLSRFEVLHHRLQGMSSKTRRFVSNHQCNFDASYFVRLGREIPRIIGNPEKYSEFFTN
jgi:hypothetical protein